MKKISRRNFMFLSGMTTATMLAQTVQVEDIPLKSRKGTASSDPWIELNLENMSWNLSQIRKRVKVPIMAVIKANAYGHGLIEIGKHLEKVGIDTFMVGKLSEALLLREQGISPPILNFGPFASQDAEKIIKNNISQSVFNENVSSLNQTALKLRKKARIQIHVDTGMGRMGISFRDALPFIEVSSQLKGIFIEGISTTLTEDDEFDRKQISRFLHICRRAKDKGISLGLKHAASSDGILNLSSSHLDMVRPGITLYGYYPSEKSQKEDTLSLRPVLQMKSRVVAVKILEPGDSISYHRKFTAQKKEKIAVIPTGYSDGFPHNVVNNACVLIKGRRYPLIAAITANHSTALLDINSPVSPGDGVAFIGAQGKEIITADEVARWAGLSTYKILIGLNPLLPRRKCS